MSTEALEAAKARLAYAQETYEGEHQRFAACDEKLMRYLQVLGLVLGITAISLDAVREILAGADARAWLFLAAYAAMFVSAGAALVTTFVALRVQSMPARSIAPEMMQAFTADAAALPTTLVEISKLFEGAVASARRVNDRRYRLARVTYNWLALSLVLALTALVLYLALPLPGSPADAVTIEIR